MSWIHASFRVRDEAGSMSLIGQNPANRDSNEGLSSSQGRELWVAEGILRLTYFLVSTPGFR